jgi:hypothetical protein
MWLQANALCARDDPEIKAAEDEAPGVVFTASSVGAILREVGALRQLRLGGRLEKSFADWDRAFALIRSGFAGVRTIDGVLLKAKNAAAAAGIRCSFGARPLLGL